MHAWEQYTKLIYLRLVHRSCAKRVDCGLRAFFCVGIHPKFIDGLTIDPCLKKEVYQFASQYWSVKIDVVIMSVGAS